MSSTFIRINDALKATRKISPAFRNNIKTRRDALIKRYNAADEHLDSANNDAEIAAIENEIDCIEQDAELLYWSLIVEIERIQMSEA